MLASSHEKLDSTQRGSVVLAVIASVVLLWLACPARGHDDLASQRTQLDEPFREELQRLSGKCEDLGLVEAARTTGEWFVRRDPRRLYFFLPLETDSTAIPGGSPKVRRQWYQRFRQVREAYAERLWELAEDALFVGRPALAYRLLHELLREDPDHEPARRILGYRRRDERWEKASAATRARRARKRHPQFGWPARTYWHVETEHFQVQSNHSEEAAVQLARQLETLHNVWRQVFFEFWTNEAALRRAWQRGDPLRSARRKHRVVLFRDRRQYVQRLRPVEPRIEITLGIYRQPEWTAYFYANGERVAATWQHEATHQLFHETSNASQNVAARVNFWIVEGIALYMESLKFRGDYCTLGGIDAERLQYARYRALNEDYYVPLENLVSMGRRQVQEDEQIRRLYSQSAGLTHFLMHYENGRYRSAVADYLCAVYDQRDHAGTLPEVTGARLSQLDEEYRCYLQVVDVDLAGVSDAVGLTKLSLGHTSVTDAGLQHLSRLTELEWLDLSHCHITDAGVAQLAGARELRQLNLERTAITDKGLQTIGEFTNLRELDLSHTVISDDGLAQLRELKDLQVLWLTGTKVTDAAVPSLRELTSLETLDVAGTKMTPGALHQLRRTLSSLDVSFDSPPRSRSADSPTDGS